jgi:nucleotide-binding universal stress UspA family protein
MTYKTLATFLTQPEAVGPTLDAAIAQAEAMDAHLDVCCVGVDATQVGYFYAGTPVMIYQETLDRAREGADALAKTAKQILGASGIRFSVESAVAQVGAVPMLVGRRARFADLVIQRKPYGPDRDITEEAIVEAALFEGETPVLVMPDGGVPKGFGKRIVVAWNQGSEALAAVRRALPLLKRADLVNVVVIDPPRQGPERSDPGGALTQMLARHGVRAEVSVIARTLPSTAEMLVRHTIDQNASLLVMGAYGHSRFREAILGGATRDMLERADVPVLMAR